jgi:hypothetical protein
MPSTTTRSRNFVKSLYCALALAVLSLSGCQWAKTRYEELRGPGFNDYSAGGGVRGDTTQAKPSGFFTDKRSDQIEQNLGGF